MFGIVKYIGARYLGTSGKLITYKNGIRVYGKSTLSHRGNVERKVISSFRGRKPLKQIKQDTVSFNSPYSKSTSRMHSVSFNFETGVKTVTNTERKVYFTNQRKLFPNGLEEYKVSKIKSDKTGELSASTNTYVKDANPDDKSFIKLVYGGVNNILRFK